MQDNEQVAIRLAREFAPEAEEILGVNGIVDNLKALSAGDIALGEMRNRVFDLGDIGSVAGALIALFMWINQIRRGQVLRGASREEIIHDLCIRVLDSDDLSRAAKERLIENALDKFPQEGK